MDEEHRAIWYDTDEEESVLEAHKNLTHLLVIAGDGTFFHSGGQLGTLIGIIPFIDSTKGHFFETCIWRIINEK